MQVLFSYLADEHVLTMYLNGKDTKQVQHIYDTNRQNTLVDEVFGDNLDLRMEKTIYLDGQKLEMNKTVNLLGELNIIHVNGMTIYADQIEIKDSVVSFLKRTNHTIIATVEKFTKIPLSIKATNNLLYIFLHFNERKKIT